MRILFLTQLLPYPPVCGGTIRSYHILKHLCAQHEVTLVSFVRADMDGEVQAHLKDLCDSVHTCRIDRSGLLNLRDAAVSLVRRRSFIIYRDRVDQMRRLVDRLLLEKRFDLIYVDHLQMSQYVLGLCDCPRVLDEHNV